MVGAVGNKLADAMANFSVIELPSGGRTRLSGIPSRQLIWGSTLSVQICFVSNRGSGGKWHDPQYIFDNSSPVRFFEEITFWLDGFSWQEKNNKMKTGATFVVFHTQSQKTLIKTKYMSLKIAIRNITFCKCVVASCYWKIAILLLMTVFFEMTLT